jgi:hypothetical protein
MNCPICGIKTDASLCCWTCWDEYKLGSEDRSLCLTDKSTSERREILEEKILKISRWRKLASI